MTNLQPDRLDQLAEHLLVATLAIESAVIADCLGELPALFIKRESILEELATEGGPYNHPVLKSVNELDDRVQECMRRKLEDIRADINKSDTYRKAHRAYLSSAVAFSH